MGGFNIAPNPAPDPAGFASAASSTYAAGLQFATALRAAAAQHQQQLQQAQQQRFKDQLQMRQAGGTPVHETRENPQGQPTLMTPEGSDPLPPVDDPSHLQTTPWGDQWHIPSQDESKALKTAPLDDTNSFQLSQALADEANRAGLTGMHEGSRLPHAMMGSLLERLKAANPGDEAQDIDTEHFSQPVRIGRRTGKVAPIDLPEGVTHNQKAVPDPSQSIIPGFLGPNGGPITRDPKTGATVELQMPTGAKRVPTEGQLERQADINARFQEREADKAEARKTAAENRAQAGRDSAQKQLDVYQQQEQPLHALRSEWGSLMTDADQRSAEAGGKPITVVDPETKREVPWNEARRKYYNAKIEATGRKIQGLQDTQKKLIERHGGDTGGGPPAPAPPTSQAKPAQHAPAQPKVATLQHVRSYAQQKGISEAAAIKEFQGYGYKIGQ